MRVAIIPARGGSKRIPRKNIRDFCGKPMIAWSIEAALASKCFDKVIVSSDDPEVLDVARGYGADTPFVRPSVLSGDFTPTGPVIAHAINELEKIGHFIEAACCIYATAPFLLAKDLEEGHERLLREGCNFVFSATRFSSPIQRSFKLNSSGGVEMFDPTMFSMRSQDLEEAYYDAGQFYWGDRDSWLTAQVVFSKNSRIVCLPSLRVQDIDTEEDWVRAEVMYRSMQLQVREGEHD